MKDLTNGVRIHQNNIGIDLIQKMEIGNNVNLFKTELYDYLSSEKRPKNARNIKRNLEELKEKPAFIVPETERYLNLIRACKARKRQVFIHIVMIRLIIKWGLTGFCI